LIPIWQDDKGKLPKGFGNKQYNLQFTEDVDKAISYATKGGEYWYAIWPDSHIKACFEASFEKKKTSNFKVEYMDLCTEFQDTDMDLVEFMTKFLILKSKYGQQATMHTAYGFALSNLFKREPLEAQNYVENFLYKQ